MLILNTDDVAVAMQTKGVGGKKMNKISRRLRCMRLKLHAFYSVRGKM